LFTKITSALWHALKAAYRFCDRLLNYKIVRILLAAIFWIAAWQAASLAVGKELLLPRPVTVAHALAAAIRDTAFWGIVLRSLLRVFLGFAAGVLLGVVLAVLSCCSKLCDTIFAPAIQMIRAVPVASFIILALLWLKSTILPAVIAGMIVLPVVWSNLCTGIRQTDVQLLEVAKVFRFGAWGTLRQVYLPSVAPYFQSACITSLGLAWKSGIAAEVLCQPKFAIGTQLYFAKVYFETPDLFAWTVVVIVLSLLVEGALAKVLKKMGGRRA